VARARAFHRPRYVALAIDLVLAFVVLGGLTQLHLPGPWWETGLAMPALVAVAVSGARLPVAWWRYQHDLRFGLSTQTPRGWAIDTAKGIAVGTVLAVLALASLFAAAHWLPNDWPWLAAPVAALLVFVLAFLAPVVLEPVFNRFAPLAAPVLDARLRALAERAGAPVREILVADASRRTTRSNAYVSGLGRTRRVVLWDTLLDSSADEIALVVAHELGHRVKRHVAVLVALNMVGTAVFVVLLWLLRPHPRPHDAAFVALLGAALELVSLPVDTALSRHFERIADRFSLTLTGDRTAYAALHRRLALENLTDLAPPRWLYYWFSTHPTPIERLVDA